MTRTKHAPNKRDSVTTDYFSTVNEKIGIVPKVIATFAVVSAVTLAVGYANAAMDKRTPADLNDLEIAHVAYTADNIDIRYAHLALAISENPKIHDFAKSMIRDHEAINKQALALLKKLKASPQNNFLSKKLTTQSSLIINEMSKLSGNKFDARYANNELGYHKAVNGLVEGSFIPNIENAEVKALFQKGLTIFRMHEQHAKKVVASLK